MAHSLSSVLYLMVSSAAIVVVGPFQSAVQAQRRAGAPASDIEAEIQAQLQQAEQGDPTGGRRSTRGTARGRGNSGFGGLLPDTTAQPGSDGAPSSPAGPAVTNEPKELVSLDLWVITVDLPRAKAVDDLSAALVQRASELTHVVGAKDDVRLLQGKLSAAGLLRRTREFHLLAANGQMAYTQAGATVPSIQGTSIQTVAARGEQPRLGRTNSTTQMNVGTIVQLTPRVLSNGMLQVTVKYESSELQKTAPPVVLSDPGDGSEPTIADQVVIQRIDTSVQLKKGTAVVVQRDTISEPGREAASIRTQLVILSASVLPAGE